MAPKTGRPRTGTLYLAKSGWRARVTLENDERRSFDLGTFSKAAARIKLKRLLKQHPGAAELEAEAKRVETFGEAAERIVGASKIRSKANREGRLRNHVLEHIGGRLVTEIRPHDVLEVLEGVAEQGFSKDLVTHVRQDIRAVFKRLKTEGIVSENVVSEVHTPEAKVDTRERAVLTDEELIRYLSWKHPAEGFEMAALERQTMACVSRMFGGVRAGDLRALEWQAFGTEGGRFEHGWAPRKKTARPQLLEVPEMLRPILRDWWERHGRPTTGPVFPTRRGARAGELKGRSNLAAALRRDLKRAFGLEGFKEITTMRGNGRRNTRISWFVAREMTPRERELFEETEFTKPVDFHSFRRAFKQALADAGMDWQQASALSGASDVKAHQRYLQNTA